MYPDAERRARKKYPNPQARCAICGAIRHFHFDLAGAADHPFVPLSRREVDHPGRRVSTASSLKEEDSDSENPDSEKRVDDARSG